MSDGSPNRRAPVWIAYLILLGLSLSLQGYRSFDGDQAYRLPILLNRQDPTLFADDPFVRAFDRFNPHVGYLALLDAGSRLVGLPATLLILYVATFAVTCIGIRRLAMALWPASGELVGVVAVALVLLADAGNIGTNHLFEPILLDRMIGFALGWVALALFVGGGGAVGSSMAASALIGLAGLVHPAVGLQLGMLLGAGLACSVVRPGAMGRRRSSAAVGLASLAAALLPTVLLQAPQRSALFEGLDPETFRLLSFQVQGPQHLIPHLWRPWQWFAWAGYLVLAALTIADRGRPWTGPRVRWVALMTALLVGLGTAWVAIEVVEDPRVTIFQPFRMATIARGLSLVAIAERVRSLWMAGRTVGAIRAAVLIAGLGGDGAMIVAVLAELGWSAGGRFGRLVGPVVLTAGLGYLSMHDTDAGQWPILGAISLSLLADRLRRRVFPSWSIGRALRLSALAWAVPILAMLATVTPESGPSWFRLARSALTDRCRFGETPRDDVERLALWCRSHTPPDARFIGPPGPKTFRLWSRRPLAFNRASSPYDGAGLADWAARFADHVGFHGSTASFARAYLDDRHALEHRYDDLPAAEKAELARRQGANHVLASAPKREPTVDVGPLELLHVEGRYAVYRVRDQGARPSSSHQNRRIRTGVGSLALPGSPSWPAVKR